MRLAGAVSSMLLVVSFVAAPARAEGKDTARPRPSKPAVTKVAVFDVRANGVDESVARTVTDVLAVELGKVEHLNVVTNEQVVSLLGLEQKKSMLGCDDNVSCMAEIAGSLGVEKLCIGSLGKIEDVSVLTLRLIDVQSAQVDRSVYAKEKSASAFLDRMPDLVAQLFPPAKGEARPAEAKAEESPEKPAVPDAAVQPAPQKKGFGYYVRRPWVWAAAGGALILLGGAMWNRTPDAGNETAASFIGMGMIAGAGSLGLCICPWNHSSDDDDAKVSTISAPDSSSANDRAQRER